jgi:hypothetical protein
MLPRTKPQRRLALHPLRIVVPLREPDSVNRISCKDAPSARAAHRRSGQTRFAGYTTTLGVKPEWTLVVHL